MVTFRGKKRLAFGIELFELEYNRINNRFRLNLVEEPFVIRKKDKDEEIRTHKVMKPAFIGDPKEGDVFFEIRENNIFDSNTIIH